MSGKTRYVALLRGINVGGKHKLPMADLKKEMTALGFANITTLLNSGNVIFDAATGNEYELEEQIGSHLQQVFGFPVPVLIRTHEAILELIDLDPFKDINITNDTRLYVSFLKDAPELKLDLPWTSTDGSFRILHVRNKMICSVLDLSVTKTPKGMDALEQFYGKNMTTRNWNTMVRIAETVSKLVS